MKTNKYITNFALFIVLVASVLPDSLYAQGVATSTPTVKPTIPPLATFTAACSLDYVFNDAIYKTTTDRTCGILVTLSTATSNYYYPARCVIAKGARSCSAKVSVLNSRNPLPPGAVIQRATVTSEKLYRAGGIDEALGCTYTSGVKASPVYNSSGAFIGANVLHQLHCAAPPQ